MNVKDGGTVEKLRAALSVMLYGYISGAYRRMADKAFAEMVK